MKTSPNYFYMILLVDSLEEAREKEDRRASKRGVKKPIEKRKGELISKLYLQMHSKAFVTKLGKTWKILMIIKKSSNEIFSVRITYAVRKTIAPDLWNSIPRNLFPHLKKKRHLESNCKLACSPKPWDNVMAVAPLGCFGCLCTV